MSEIIIIAKKNLHKDYNRLTKLIDTKHRDYFQLSFLLKRLENYRLKYIFLTWDEFENSDELDCNLLIIPQRMFLSGPVPPSDKCWDKLDLLKKNGTNFLFLHHPDWAFIDNKYLDVERTNYFLSKVLKYSITNNYTEELLNNVYDIISSGKNASDEFTYFLKGGNQFIPLIEKIPVKMVKAAPKKFVCFGYQIYPNNNRAFFVDIHSVGAKKRMNGILFEQIIANILSSIFRIENEEDNLINELEKSNLSETEKKALIDSRIGQGKFRQLLIDYWKGCSVTRIKTIELLKASHIKPWRVSNNFERLDPYNGLLLQPNIDSLFDKGYITFTDRGNIILSVQLPKTDSDRLGINSAMNIKLNKNHKKYLEYHRNNIFKK